MLTRKSEAEKEAAGYETAKDHSVEKEAIRQKGADDGGKVVRLSPLGKTWILDLDGTIVKHNGYKIDGYDQFLDGAKEFLNGIGDGDLVIFVTSRTEEYAGITEQFLRENGVRYDLIVYGAPYGERIVVNDCKPSGLRTAVAVNTVRDEFMQHHFLICE